jgi:hypothetical protein
MIQRNIPNPFQSMYRTLIAAAFLMNIPAVMMMMSGNRAMTSMFGLVQFLMFGAGVALLIHGKSIVRNILHLLNGPMLLHWTYDEDHWKEFSREEFRQRRLATIAVLVSLLLAGPAASLAGFGGISINDGMLLGSILGLTGFGVMNMYARGVLKRSGLPPFEAFIAAKGAFINGVFIDWSTSGTILLDIRLDGRGKAALLVLRYSVRTLKGRREKEITVPVPNGNQQDASAAIGTIMNTANR